MVIVYLLLNFALINLQIGGATNIVVIAESNIENTECDTNKRHTANNTNIQEITFNNTILKFIFSSFLSFNFIANTIKTINTINVIINPILVIVQLVLSTSEKFPLLLILSKFSFTTAVFSTASCLFIVIVVSELIPSLELQNNFVVPCSFTTIFPSSIVKIFGFSTTQFIALSVAFSG